jgi:hypothetical protein
VRYPANIRFAGVRLVNPMMISAAADGTAIEVPLGVSLGPSQINEHVFGVSFSMSWICNELIRIFAE